MGKLSFGLALLTVLYIVFLYLTAKTLISDSIKADHKKKKSEIRQASNGQIKESL